VLAAIPPFDPYTVCNLVSMTFAVYPVNICAREIDTNTAEASATRWRSKETELGYRAGGACIGLPLG